MKAIENTKQDIFMRKLQDLAGVSLAYAQAAWFTLADIDKNNPDYAATEYHKKLQTFRIAFNK